MSHDHRVTSIDPREIPSQISLVASVFGIDVVVVVGFVVAMTSDVVVGGDRGVTLQRLRLLLRIYQHCDGVDEDVDQYPI